MSKLEELIKEFCPNGVICVTIGKICKISRGIVMSKDFIRDNHGDYPVYSSQTENNGCLGYINTYKYDGEYVTWTTDGANAGTVFYRSGKFSITNVCGLLEVKDLMVINTKYLYYALSIEARRYVNQGFMSLQIPLPALPVQREIVRVLDSFTLYSAELTAELTARRKQYEFYRDKLLNFESDSVEWKPIEDLFPLIRNGFVGTVTPYFTDKANGVRYLEGTNIHNAVISDNEELYVTKEFHKKHIRNELKADDILMVQSGHIGDCAVVGKKYAGANCHALIIMSNGGACSSKFYVHYFHTYSGFKSLAPAITGGTIQHVLAGKIGKIKVPVPPIDVQERIVKVLDNFDALCSDLGIGLPAEIEKRQKQYEYYRDKLLTFEGKNNNGEK